MTLPSFACFAVAPCTLARLLRAGSLLLLSGAPEGRPRASWSACHMHQAVQAVSRVAMSTEHQVVNVRVSRREQAGSLASGVFNHACCGCCASVSMASAAAAAPPFAACCSCSCCSCCSCGWFSSCCCPSSPPAAASSSWAAAALCCCGCCRLCRGLGPQLASAAGGGGVAARHAQLRKHQR